jgi:curved DNA-binding protein CbpA
VQDFDFERLDYYALLGVERNASSEEIKRAYRQQIIRYHPDRFMSASPEEQEYARQRTLRINEAYATLSDFAARSAYNRKSLGSQGTAATPPPKPQTPPPPRDHQAELYNQARAHIEAGRNVQALALLRQLQQP